MAIGAITALPISTPPAGASSVALSTNPALTPAFDATISDYIVRCAAMHTVTLSAVVPAGDTLSIDGGPAQSGSVAQSVVLYPGQALNWAIDDGATVTTYTARCLPADFPQWTATVSGTPQAQWFMAAPAINRQGPAPKYVVIADDHGTPVWWMRDGSDLGPIDQKLVMEPSGPAVVWASEPFFGFATYGFYDFTGQLERSIGGDLDLHDLQRTASGTYLAIKYLPRACPAVPADCVDESTWGGPASVNPIDGKIVERDGANNELWSWSTRGHISLDESADWLSSGQREDIIHMNSVEPDGTTGVIFSARHLNAVYDASRTTGDILWKLGGTPTPQSLTVVGDTSGGAVFSGQHDARLLPDGTLTVHDNGTLLGRAPRALRFRLDLVNRTATVVENVSDARVTSSPCCGSARRLTGGDWVTSWGGNSLATELTPAGEPVWTAAFSSGVFSYRVVPVEPGVVSAATLRAGMDAMPPASFTTVTPTPNPSMIGDNVTLTAAVDARAGHGAPTGTVQFSDGGVALGAPQPLGASGTAALVTSALSEGTHAITAAYSGDATFPASTSASVSQVVNAPLSARVVVPSDGSTLSGTAALLDADAHGPVAGVDFRITGGTLSDAVVGTATNSAYGWLLSWDTTTVPEGTYSLRARATDSASGVAYSPPITITVQNLSTKIVIPSNGATVSGSVLLDADAKGPVASVQFRVSGGSYNDTLIGTATNSPYGWLLYWNTSKVAKRTYTLRSRVLDGLGHSALSPPITVTVGKGGKR